MGIFLLCACIFGQLVLTVSAMAGGDKKPKLAIGCALLWGFEIVAILTSLVYAVGGIGPAAICLALFVIVFGGGMLWSYYKGDI